MQEILRISDVLLKVAVKVKQTLSVLSELEIRCVPPFS